MDYCFFWFLSVVLFSILSPALTSVADTLKFRCPQVGVNAPPQATASQLLLWGLFYFSGHKCVLRKILYICIFRCVILWAQKSLFLPRSNDLPETSAHFPLSYCFFRTSFTETFFSPELLLPKNDQLKGISQHIHLSSAVLSSSAKNDKPIDFKFLLIRMNPLSWNLKWNSLGPWKRTWQLQSCDYSLIFSPLNALS